MNALAHATADVMAAYVKRRQQPLSPPATKTARAVCVLVVEHLQRNRSGRNLATYFGHAPDEHLTALKTAIAVQLDKDQALARQLEILLDRFEHQHQPQPQPVAPVMMEPHYALSHTQAGGHMLVGNGNHITETGGGAIIHGNGNIVGNRLDARTLNQNENDVTINQGLDETAIAELFNEVYRQIDALPNLAPEERDDLRQDVRELEEEVRLPTHTSPEPAQVDSFLSRRLENIERMAPDIVDVILASMAGPMEGLSTVVSKIVTKSNELQASRPAAF